MTDNIELSAGSGGAVVKTDDDGTAQWQYVKIAFGADNTQTRVTGSSGLPAVLLAGTAEFGKLAAGTAEIGNVKNSGTFATQATLQAGTAEIGKLAAGTAEIGNVTNSGTFATQATLQAGTAEIGKLAAGTAEIGNVANSGTFATQATLQTGSALAADVGLSGARTSGGTTLYKNIDVDESEDEVKGTAGQIYWLHAINLASGVRYLKIYNATAASVTVGTTVPDLTFPIPTQGDANAAGFTLSLPNGIAFGTAITIAATTGVADNDSGAPSANEVVVNLGYA